MTVEPQGRLRADAQRNRELVIAAAKELFAQVGPEAPMEEIARRAGVGVGTLYRRFPDRESLVQAVARDTFQKVLDDAAAAEVEAPTPLAALVLFLNSSLQVRLSVQLAMSSPLARNVLEKDPMMLEFRERLLVGLERLLKAAQADGSIRDDVGVGDVAIMLALLLKELPFQAGKPNQLVQDRCLALMVDALRARPGSTLPGRPLHKEDLLD